MKTDGVKINGQVNMNGKVKMDEQVKMEEVKMDGVKSLSEKVQSCLTLLQVETVAQSGACKAMVGGRCRFQNISFFEVGAHLDFLTNFWLNFHQFW